MKRDVKKFCVAHNTDDNSMSKRLVEKSVWIEDASER